MNDWAKCKKVKYKDKVNYGKKINLNDKIHEIVIIE